MYISTRTKVSLGIIIISLVWGSTWLVIKIGLEGTPPILAAGFRFFIASLLLYVIVRMRGRNLPKEKEFWKLATILAFNTFGIPFALVYWGQHHISSSLASILFAIFPFCVALIAHIRLPEEQMTLSKGLGILLGFSGIYVIFASELAMESELAVWGMAAIVLTAVLQASALVTLKKRGKPFDPLPLNFAAMAGGAIILLFMSFVFEDYSALRVNAATIGSMLYLAIFSSVVTFVIYFWLVKHVQAVLLSLTAFVTPIIAVVLGTLVLNERLAPQIVAGSTLVLLGILLANLAELWKSLRRKRTFVVE